MLAEDDKWFSVSLRLMGDSINPDSLEKILGLKTDCISRKGERKSGKNGRTYAPASTNVWSYRVARSSDVGFNAQIRVLFQELGDRVGALADLANTEGVDAELFCGFGSGNGQGGDEIEPDTLQLICDARLSLSLDLYPPDVDELEQQNKSEQDDPNA